MVDIKNLMNKNLGAQDYNIYYALGCLIEVT